MAVDPAVLSCTLPHAYPIHYWVKDALFANPVAGAILRAAGNIPVDRKNKNNQSLFKGSFEALARGEHIAVFPEGTSHTSPHLLPFKDGISWLAMEYLRYLNGEADGVKKDGKKAGIVPAGLTYLDKQKYRSRVVVTYGPYIDIAPYAEEFLSGDEGAARSAVKKLTSRLELEMRKLTVNAVDWDSMIAANMSRDLLFEKESSLAPEDYLKVTQTLADMFSPLNPDTDSEQLRDLRELLVEYNNMLITCKLTNKTLSDIPVPTNLDPHKPIPIPSRFSTLILLIRDTISVLIRVPFFFLPMVLHLPMYYVAKMGQNIVREELETQAQMKIVFGMLFTLLVYPAWFILLWLTLGFTAVGALIAGVAVYLFNMSHMSLVDENYDSVERLIAAWRIVLGVWSPKRREKPLDYIKPFMPTSAAPFGATPEGATLPWQRKEADKRKAEEEKKNKEKKKTLPTRRLIKHALRKRIAASQALESFLGELEQGQMRVNASPWLAEEAAHGGLVEETTSRTVSAESEAHGDRWTEKVPKASRLGSEVREFLKERGAKVPKKTQKQNSWANGKAAAGNGRIKSDED